MPGSSLAYPLPLRVLLVPASDRDLGCVALTGYICERRERGQKEVAGEQPLL